jgi:hypothetical protein
MLKRIEIGQDPKPDTLVITPEFFAELRTLANRSYGAYVRLRFYPLFSQWVAISSISGGVPTIRQFDVERVPVMIPKSQCQLFESRVIGYERSIPGLPLLGFIG